MRHLGPLALFGALAAAWTFPLALHLHDAVPGHPGDNYSFLWNLWWMRHVLATPGLAYFHTTYLFHPFGTSIANHPHTALPALVAATVLKSVSVVTAQNLLLLAYVFANMAAMYALAWDVTRHRRAACWRPSRLGLPCFSPSTSRHLIRRRLLPAFAGAPRRAVRSARTRRRPRRAACCRHRLHRLLLRRLRMALRGGVSAASVEGVTIACAGWPQTPAVRWLRVSARRSGGVGGDRDRHPADTRRRAGGGRDPGVGDDAAERADRDVDSLGWLLGGWRPTLTVDPAAGADCGARRRSLARRRRLQPARRRLAGRQADRAGATT
jgi:hypothetical protein